MSGLSHPKIAPDGEAARAALEKVRAGRCVVFTNGCFDVLHAGHVNLLERARALGDLLVVGVNDDASVGRLKGPGRPVTPLDERLYVLAGLESVSLAAPFSEDTPMELIRLVEPDVLVKGGDWPVDKIVGRDFVESRGGRVLSLELLPGYSTTAFLRRVLSELGQ
jgi:rfaE bifunctional protein nucleotidyltransferase chain/domain